MSDGGPDDFTLTDALADLRAEGFEADFSVAGRALRCGRCGESHDPGHAEILRTVRFEGASDPDDEAILFGLTCAHCGARGVLVTAYGPLIEEDEAAVIKALVDRRT